MKKLGLLLVVVMTLFVVGCSKKGEFIKSEKVDLGITVEVKK